MNQNSPSTTVITGASSGIGREGRAEELYSRALHQHLAGREVLAIALVVVASAGALRESPTQPAPEA